MSAKAKVGLYLFLLVVGLIVGALAGGEIVRRVYRGIGVRELKEAGTGDALSQSGQARDGGAGVQSQVASSRQSAIVLATQKVAPCVVGIVVTQLQVVGPSYQYGDFFDLFFGPNLMPRYREVENMGSGFTIDAKGIILTNNHVVQGAEKLYINFPDGRQAEGKVLGADPYSDIAVVSVVGDGLQCVTFGNSDELLIGEWVIAIGNPFLNFFNDPRPTVTVGVVSALNRNFVPSQDVYYQGMIQTDAAINPGNSGGPLVNANGEVIGINSFIYTGSRQSKGSIGIGFAIPANRAKRVVVELMRYGRRRQVWTGITVQDLDRAIALTLGVKSMDGVVVTDIQRGSPGGVAGLKAGDVIMGMGERAIRTHGDLEGFFLDYFVGDSVRISFIRNGRTVSGMLVLKEYPTHR